MEILLLLAFIAVFISISVMNKRNRAQKIAQQEQNKTDAQALKMSVNSSTSFSNKYNFLAEEDYSGTTGDIQWTLVSKEIEFNNNNHHSHTWKRTTLWSTMDVKMQEGKFLMFMSTPRIDNSKNKIKKGFFAGIVNTFAELAIDLYVGSYFGPQYKSLVNIDGAVKIDIPELKNFFILTNDESLSKKLLNDVAVKFIVNWMHNKPRFAHESNVNMWGALFSEDGVIVSCQADMTTAAEAKVFADFGASLATLMKEATLQVS
jgi:hypothetical protein